jgi:hypothetical protein
MTVKEDIKKQLPGSGTRSGPLADPPEIKGQIPGDGRILLEELKKPSISVTIMALKDGLFGGGKARVLGNKKGFDEVLLGEVNIPEEFSDFFPHDIQVDTAKIPDDPSTAGPTEYYCRFHIEDGLGIEDNSDPIVFSVDKNPPYYVKSPYSRASPPFAVFKNLNVAGGEVINDAWVAKNPTGLVVQIAKDYLHNQENDLVTFCASNRSGTTTTMPVVYSRGVFPKAAGATSGEFTVPVEVLKTLPNGGLYHRYVLHDAPLNKSQDSILTGAPTLPIAFLPPPILKALRVPAAGPTHSEEISLGTFLPVGTKIDVEIDYPDNGDPKDVITVSINGPTGAPKVVGTGDLGNRPGPLSFNLSYDILDEVTTGATGEVTVQLSYTLKRGTNTAIDSPETSLFVNFVFPGPEPDLLPNLDNDNLLPVEIKGQEGAGTLNHLTTADIDKPVRFTATRWTGAPNLLEDALITFYWAGKNVGNETMTNADTSVFINVDFSLISEAGLGTVEAYYTIEYPDNPNVMRQAPATDVLVETFQISLLDHKGPPFIELGGKRYITCKTMVPRTVAGGVTTVPPLKVSVPGGQRDAPTGREVTMRMQGWEKDDATLPIKDVAFTNALPMPAGNADLVFEMDYKLFKDIQEATPPTNPVKFYYAQIWYEIDLGGTKFNSKKEMHPVRVRNSSLLYCDDLDAGSDG